MYHRNFEEIAKTTRTRGTAEVCPTAIITTHHLTAVALIPVRVNPGPKNNLICHMALVFTNLRLNRSRCQTVCIRQWLTSRLRWRSWSLPVVNQGMNRLPDISDADLADLSSVHTPRLEQSLRPPAGPNYSRTSRNRNKKGKTKATGLKPKSEILPWYIWILACSNELVTLRFSRTYLLRSKSKFGSTP